MSKRGFFLILSHILLHSVIKFKCYPSNSILGKSRKYWYVLINAKIYLTYVHRVKAVLTFTKTHTVGRPPHPSCSQLPPGFTISRAFVSRLLLPADLFSSPTLTKLSYLFPDFLAEPADLVGCCICLGSVADNRYYYSWFNNKKIKIKKFYCQVLGA